jgi:hypothetical protein
MNPLRAFNYLLAAGVVAEHAALAIAARGGTATLGIAPALVWIALAANPLLAGLSWWLLTRRIAYCATGSVTRTLTAMFVASPLALAAGLAGPAPFGCALLVPYGATLAIAAKTNRGACRTEATAGR